MRKVKLTTTVIKGILALAKPGMVDAMQGRLSFEEMKNLAIFQTDITAANKAIDWASSVQTSLQYPPPQPKPSYNDLVIPDFD